MKKHLAIIVLALTFTSMPLAAAIIDKFEARQLALEFISQMNLDGFSNPILDGVLTINSSTDSSTQVLHVYNVYSRSESGSRFVIVSGESRTKRILAYGDCALDMTDIPVGLQELIDLYRQQIESLIASRPGEEVMLCSTRPGSGRNDPVGVEPLLTTMWGQDAPFNLCCPQYNGDKYCSTGCVSTALSMIIHYHSFAQFVEPIPEYTTTKLGIHLEPLEPVDFDWYNMRDVYQEGEYTADEAQAVAQLMRYTGQAAMMDYTTGASAALVSNITKALKRFGYDGNLILRNNYATDAWSAILQEELYAGRPVIYIANQSQTNSGHAFCVDGYDASLEMYHINWGWNGKGNCECVLDAFSPSTSNSVYSGNQMMVTHIQPATPGITVDCNDWDFQEYTGFSQTKTFTVSGMNLTGDVSLSVADVPSWAHFTVSPSTITPAEAAAGKTIKVTFSPSNQGGSSTAKLVLSSNDIEPDTVTMNCLGIKSQGIIHDYLEDYTLSTQIGANGMVLQPYKILMIPFSWIQFYSVFNPLDNYDNVYSAPSSNAEGNGTMGPSKNTFSYDLQGDEAYLVGLEYVKTTRSEPGYYPNDDANGGGSGEYAIQILYRFTTLGEHNATLTITHSSLTVKPVVIHLNGNTTWSDDADYLYGDVNGDEATDVGDVTALIAYILGKAGGINEQAADVNGDGSIDVSDVTALISHIIGN